MQGKEQRLYGDSAYRGAKQKAAMRQKVCYETASSPFF